MKTMHAKSVPLTTRKGWSMLNVTSRSVLPGQSIHPSFVCHASRDTEQQGVINSPLEIAVPKDQRPVNELAALRNAPLYNWAKLETGPYVQRLIALYIVFFSLIGGPIAYQTFDPSQQTAEWVLSGSVGALLVVATAVLRIYLGWSYVGNRLMSASVEYEETGWYDGQVFVKPPEVLTRDRLLGMYEVKPVMSRLKSTLLASGASLVVSAVLLTGFISSTADADGMYGRGASVGPRVITSDGIAYSSRVKDLSQLAYDDDLAAEEASAAGGRPGYCGDRYFRALAGGQYCAQYDL